jgi:hypothetical protein
MDKNQLLKQLEIAETAIQSIRKLVDDPVFNASRSSEEVERLVADNCCLRCGKRLTGKVSRGVHERCYQKLRRDSALNVALQLGHILPVGKPGPRSAPAILANAKEAARQKK